MAGQGSGDAAIGIRDVEVLQPLIEERQPDGIESGLTGAPDQLLAALQLDNVLLGLVDLPGTCWDRQKSRKVPCQLGHSERIRATGALRIVGTSGAGRSSGTIAGAGSLSQSSRVARGIPTALANCSRVRPRPDPCGPARSSTKRRKESPAVPSGYMNALGKLYGKQPIAGPETGLERTQSTGVLP